MEGSAVQQGEGTLRKRALPASVLAMLPASKVPKEAASTKTPAPDAVVDKENGSSSNTVIAVVPKLYVSTYSGDPTLLPHSMPQGVKVFVAETSEQCLRFCKEIAARGAKAAACGSRVAIGFDIEWVVTFERGQPQRRASLLQLCFLDAVILFRLLSICPLPALLFDILQDDTIYKVGVNVAGDAAKLERDYSEHFLLPSGDRGRVRGLLDIRHLLKAFRVSRTPSSQSLKELAAFYLNCLVQKEPSVRQSDWEAHKLSARQVEYAAADAHLSLQLYHRVLKIAIEERFPLLNSRATSTPCAATASAVTNASSSNNSGGSNDWKAYVCHVLSNVAEELVTETVDTLELHRSINGSDLKYSEYALQRRRDEQAAYAAGGEEA